LKSILVLSLTDLASDPRVNRQIRLLAGRYRVSTAGTAPPRVDGVEYVPVPQIPKPLHIKAIGALALKLGAYERWYWMDRRVRRALAALGRRKFDLILANDLVALPLALRIANGAKILYDAHEYSPREYEESFLWRFLFQRYNDYLCRTYLPRADGMLTVCQSIAEEYRANYGVSPRVMMNAPAFQELAPRATDGRGIRLVHHGGAAPSRNLELMIEAMDHLDNRFSLDMMLVPSDRGYLERLKSTAAKRPRVQIVPPVPMRELPTRLNEYDVGVYLLPPNSFNNEHALPNKFFEFVQARLALVIGPSPEMARLVRQYNCGVVSDDFTPQSLAGTLKALSAEQVDEFKRRSDLAARDLCFERNAEVLLGMVDELIGKI
jgi:hypothetical protein